MRELSLPDVAHFRNLSSPLLVPERAWHEATSERVRIPATANSSVDREVFDLIFARSSRMALWRALVVAAVAVSSIIVYTYGKFVLSAEAATGWILVFSALLADAAYLVRNVQLGQVDRLLRSHLALVFVSAVGMMTLVDVVYFVQDNGTFAIALCLSYLSCPLYSISVTHSRRFFVVIWCFPLVMNLVALVRQIVSGIDVVIAHVGSTSFTYLGVRRSGFALVLTVGLTVLVTLRNRAERYTSVFIVDAPTCAELQYELLRGLPQGSATRLRAAWEARRRHLAYASQPHWHTGMCAAAQHPSRIPGARYRMARAWTLVQAVLDDFRHCLESGELFPPTPSGTLVQSCSGRLIPVVTFRTPRSAAALRSAIACGCACTLLFVGGTLLDQNWSAATAVCTMLLSCIGFYLLCWGNVRWDVAWQILRRSDTLVGLLWLAALFIADHLACTHQQLPGVCMVRSWCNQVALTLTLAWINIGAAIINIQPKVDALVATVGSMTMIWRTIDTLFFEDLAAPLLSFKGTAIITLDGLRHTAAIQVTLFMLKLVLPRALNVISNSWHAYGHTGLEAEATTYPSLAVNSPRWDAVDAFVLHTIATIEPAVPTHGKICQMFEGLAPRVERTKANDHQI